MSLAISPLNTGAPRDSLRIGGERVGPYRILEELGRSNVTAVYKAWDLQRGCAVALKVIIGAGLFEEQLEPLREAVCREAAIAGRMKHPGIMSLICNPVDDAGNPYIVMDFLGGGTLEQALEPSTLREPLSLARRLDLSIEVADALEYMHSRGIVHRDIKPSNILLTQDGHACIADFGIALLMDADDARPEALPGTPAFVAPELWNDARANARSDIFSLGVLLYWMFTGKIPFAGDTVTEITNNVAYCEPPPVQQHNWALPRELDRILGQSLAKNPLERYARAHDLSNELVTLRHALEPAAARIATVKPPDARPGSAPSFHSDLSRPSSAGPRLVSANAPQSRPRKDYSAAIRVSQGSLVNAQELFGRSHFKTAEILGQLGLLCHKEGRYAEAEEYHAEALRIRESQLGAWNEKVATSLNNLALLYRDQGRLAEARKLLERSLAIEEKIFGMEHPKTALRLSNLADLLYRQADEHHAETLYARLARMVANGKAGAVRNEFLLSLRNYRALLTNSQRAHEADRIESLIQAAENGSYRSTPLGRQAGLR